MISGTGGLRKIRLAATSKGKSGSFRVLYYDDSTNGFIFLIWIYQKNEQDNISAEEKKLFKQIIKTIKDKDNNNA